MPKFVYRLIGKFFFLFCICPFLAEIGSFIVKYTLKKLDDATKTQSQKNREERARSRRDHPAGSRLPQD